MELLFNELSVKPACEDKYRANERMEKFIKTVAAARKQGIKNIRSELPSNLITLADGYSMHDWIFNKNDVPDIYRNLLVGMIVLPFIRDEDVEITDKYIQSNFFFEDVEGGIAKTTCAGLASAFLYETPSISLASLPIWEKTILTIIVETNDKESIIETNVNVFNVSSGEAFEDEQVSSFIQSISELNLVETDVVPDDKKIHLADHHGKAELQDLCEKLKVNSYVLEMRSMEWCRGKCDRFVKKVHRNGVIELVLFKTDRKYGLWVQTTGRNIRETNAIADILEKTYA